MLASGERVTADTVKHIDRCLSCLSCMTTCPSGVNYMHLVDHARRWIEKNYRRPRGERILRRFLGTVLSRPLLFRLSLRCAAVAKPLARFLTGRLAPLFALAPSSVPPASPTDRPQVFAAEGERRMRVALLPGCAQKVLAPRDQRGDDPAADPPRLRSRGRPRQWLLRVACASSRPGRGGARFCARQHRCVGTRAPRLRARRHRDQRLGLRHDGQGLRLHAARGSAYAEKAARIATLARDVTEVIATLGLCRADA